MGWAWPATWTARGEQVDRDRLQLRHRQAPGWQERPDRRRPGGARTAGPPGARADASRRGPRGAAAADDRPGQRRPVRQDRPHRAGRGLGHRPRRLREQLRLLSREWRARASAALTCCDTADRQTRVLHQTFAWLGQRMVALVGVVAELEAQITEIVEEMAPGPGRSEYGLGYLRVQILLSWSCAGRIRASRPSRCSEALHSSVSSGRTTGTGLTGSATPAQPRHPHHRRHPHMLPPAHLSLCPEQQSRW